MKIIPVIDIQNGVVVRGVGGRREEYRPIVSRLTTSCQPVDVAKAFRDDLGLTEIYLADLDAIAGSLPSLSIYGDIQALGSRLWVDRGVRTVTDVSELVQHGIESIVVGLETVTGPDVLRTTCRDLNRKRIIFSLDLKNGRPIGRLTTWNQHDAHAIAAQAIEMGIRRLLVLDLALVGTGKGTGTEDLCHRLVRDNPHTEIIAGGGVRDAGDLRRLRDCGVACVLVASALHERQLLPEHWRYL
jgi:phosphoribosylformimino-5-aminoimidazole carboxamide ribotide isomerase